MNFRICYTLALSLTTYIKLGSDIVDTLAMSQAAPGRAEAILNVPSSQYPFHQATYLRPWHSLYCVWPPAPVCLLSTWCYMTSLHMAPVCLLSTWRYMTSLHMAPACLPSTWCYMTSLHTAPACLPTLHDITAHGSCVSTVYRRYMTSLHTAPACLPSTWRYMDITAHC